MLIGRLVYIADKSPGGSAKAVMANHRKPLEAWSPSVFFGTYLGSYIWASMGVATPKLIDTIQRGFSILRLKTQIVGS